jgi:dTDP-4-amino-4,6-dideoxygalactose transaminase
MGTLELLRAAGVGTGDEVIVPAFGNVEVAESVVHAGAHPVFADIDPASYCLDPNSVNAAVNPQTAAVIAVHRFGRPADMTRLHAVGERHGLLVLGQGEPDTVPDRTAQRITHAALLDLRLNGVLTPEGCPGHSYQQYVVRVPGNGRPDRDAFALALRTKGVACQVPVKTPLHRLPRFRRDIRLPETERAADETLSLPVHPGLHTSDIRRIISACNALGGLLQPA